MTQDSAAETHITHDPAYETVAADDFGAMVAIERYGRRSDAFDGIIGATHDHFWDPYNPAYLDFTQQFDLDREPIMPLARFPELNCAATDHLDEGTKIRLANQIQRWTMSNILHGEQGALSLSASLCDILLDPGAQEYAANQAREEARHVAAFGRYIAVRWGEPYPVGPVLGDFLRDIVSSPIVYKKLIGMQMLLEGLAMGAFANVHAHTRDPLLKRLVQLVMTDEAFHHRFGKIWADRTLPEAEPRRARAGRGLDRAGVRDAAVQPVEPGAARVYLRRVRARLAVLRESVRERFVGGRKNSLREGTNIFRVWSRRCLRPGSSPTARSTSTRPGSISGELDAEGDTMVGDAIAADGHRVPARHQRQTPSNRAEADGLGPTPVRRAAPWPPSGRACRTLR